MTRRKHGVDHRRRLGSTAAGVRRDGPAPEGMRFIPGGEFMMGSDRFYTEEAPARRVRIDAFLIDETPVTNAAFARFVAATGYVTGAEIAPDPRDYPGVAPELARPGSAVFDAAAIPVGSRDAAQGWRFVIGADWRHPAGPGSSIDGLDDHPVVHVTAADAAAYARWAGKLLPTEAEWECAARGGLDGADYAWGEEFSPNGRAMANIWHGAFPFQRLPAGPWERTSPVGAFPANGFGLHDMIGNVWEWTADWYAPHRAAAARGGCCAAVNPRGARRHDSLEPGNPSRTPRRVLKGGSHLCAANYCRRYRPAARQPEPIDTSTSHIGFRCARRL